MPVDAFISYSHKDKTTADAACATLEGAGVRCWIAPRDVTPGADWSGSIVEAIRAAKVFVLIYSGEADTSRQIRNELVLATQSGLAIVPFRIEDVPPSDALSYHLSGVHWLDALSPPLEAHLNALLAAVQRLLALAAGGRAATPLAAPAPIAPSAPTSAPPGGAWFAWSLVAGLVVLGLAVGGYFALRAPAAARAPDQDPTALSFAIVPAGNLTGDKPIELTAPSGRVMICLAGNQTGKNRQCHWK